MMTATRMTVLSVLVVVMCIAPASVRGAEPAGSVSGLEGQAEVLRAGATWAPLAVGDPVFVGDQVRTLPDAKLKLLFRDESIYTLAPSSTLEVSEQMAGAAAP